MLREGGFDVCTLVYNRFHSVISQITTETRLIPAAAPAREEGAESTVLRAAYEFEPEEDEHPRPPAAPQPRDPDLPLAARERGRRAGCAG